MCIFVLYFTCRRIIVNYMIGAIVRSKMILHRRVCMTYSDMIIARVPGQFCCFKKQFQIEHVINNDRKIPTMAIMIPRTDASDLRIKACCQSFSGLDNDIPIMCIGCKTITVTNTTENLKAHIMGFPIILFAFYTSGQFTRQFFPFMFSGFLV
ncbi:hypothetical protein D3C86_1282840 [compost metagenome]